MKLPTGDSRQKKQTKEQRRSSSKRQNS